MKIIPDSIMHPAISPREKRSIGQKGLWMAALAVFAVSILHLP